MLIFKVLFSKKCFVCMGSNKSHVFSQLKPIAKSLQMKIGSREMNHFLKIVQRSLKNEKFEGICLIFPCLSLFFPGCSNLEMNSAYYLALNRI